MNSSQNTPNSFPDRPSVFFSLAVLIVTLFLHGAEYGFNLHGTNKNSPFNGWHEGILYTWGYPVNGIFFEHKKKGRPPVTKAYRQKPFNIQKSALRYRIMVLGDSFTFGEGIAEEDMYTNRLEHELASATPNRSVEVLNFGLRGADTVLEKFILETSIDTVKPDLVIIGFCSNDPKRRGEEYSLERAQFYERNGYWINILSEQLALAGLPLIGKRFQEAIETVIVLMGIAPSWETRIKNAYDKNGREWGEFLDALKAIKSLSDHQHLPTPLFVVLTASRDSDENERYKQAEEAAKEIGFRTLNFENEVRSEFNNQPLIAPWGGHPSKELNKVYAEKIFSVVRVDMQNYFSQKKGSK